MAEKLANLSRFELSRLEGQVNCLFAMVTRTASTGLKTKRQQYTHVLYGGRLLIPRAGPDHLEVEGN